MARKTADNQVRKCEKCENRPARWVTPIGYEVCHRCSHDYVVRPIQREGRVK
jgi:hypothetical protein